MGINLHNMDCLKALKEMNDNKFDLAIVDPPYGINVSKKRYSASLCNVTDYKLKDWDSKSPNKDYFKQLKRVSKNQIIWGANHFIENIPNANSSCWIVWDKDNTGAFADCELAYASFKTAVRKFKWRWNGMLQENMKNKQKRIHPTEKPIKLYEWLLMNYAEKGYKILDTHLGSGSIAIACHNLGYDLEGYELDKEYFDAACKRLKRHQQQLTIF
tara:strand:+ start:1250 stop:1894 length:645 start_codon:yes stop_codon:yes gene_type:complete